MSTATSIESTTASESADSPSPTPTSNYPPGQNPTIATYIKDNGITETTVKHGDPGAPTIDLPVPDGWQPAGAKTPADGALIYTASDTAQIVSIFSKLTGNVDSQKILDLAPGELKNLPGFTSGDEGKKITLGGYPAYQWGGTYQPNGGPELIAQKTVVIPASNGLYVLQLNVYGKEGQSDILSAATDVIDAKTTITV